MDAIQVTIKINNIFLSDIEITTKTHEKERKGKKKDKPKEINKFLIYESKTIEDMRTRKKAHTHTLSLLHKDIFLNIFAVKIM